MSHYYPDYRYDYERKPKRLVFVVTCNGCNSDSYFTDKQKALAAIGQWTLDGYTGACMRTLTVPDYVKEGWETSWAAAERK